MSNSKQSIFDKYLLNGALTVPALEEHYINSISKILDKPKNEIVEELRRLKESQREKILAENPLKINWYGKITKEKVPELLELCKNVGTKFQLDPSSGQFNLVLNEAQSERLVATVRGYGIKVSTNYPKEELPVYIKENLSSLENIWNCEK